MPPGTTGPEPFRSANPKFTHRVRVSSPEQVTPELVGWMRLAADHVRK